MSLTENVTGLIYYKASSFNKQKALVRHKKLFPAPQPSLKTVDGCSSQSLTAIATGDFLPQTRTCPGAEPVLTRTGGCLSILGPTNWKSLN